MTKEQIINTINENKNLDNNKLADICQVRPETIRRIKRSMSGYVKINNVNINIEKDEQKEIVHFDINKRFDFMTKLVTMVTKGIQQSLFIAGDGGLGKTHTVLDVLKNSGVDYLFVKGHSSAAGLYKLLYDNADSLIVFDDCDSVFKDETSANILKAATDSYEKRIVNYNIKSKDMETSFEFTGQIIFISNLSIQKFPQALQSRSTVVDLSMTTEEKIIRIETVLASINVGTIQERQLALQFIKENAYRIKDINFRTLIKVTKILAEYNDSELALFVALN